MIITIIIYYTAPLSHRWTACEISGKRVIGYYASVTVLLQCTDEYYNIIHILLASFVNSLARSSCDGGRTKDNLPVGSQSTRTPAVLNLSPSGTALAYKVERPRKCTYYYNIIYYYIPCDDEIKRFASNPLLH